MPRERPWDFDTLTSRRRGRRRYWRAVAGAAGCVSLLACRRGGPSPARLRGTSANLIPRDHVRAVVDPGPYPGVVHLVDQVAIDPLVFWEEGLQHGIACAT